MAGLRVYLEGSDQHRGWFHSSLLESCGTRGRAPYDTGPHPRLHHGRGWPQDVEVAGNQVFPQDVIKQYGADILRLWDMNTCDYWEDQRIGRKSSRPTSTAYRKLRNTLRWMLGSLAHDDESVEYADMPELER
jgi:isoleucyl-tRNA synthetase